MDSHSEKILRELQLNAHLSVNELSEKVGLSATPCWRRQKELEENGVIKRYAAILDRQKTGLLVCCFTHICLLKHAEDAMTSFERAVRSYPEVVECYETTGMADYILKIVVRDIEAYHDFCIGFYSKCLVYRKW